MFKTACNQRLIPHKNKSIRARVFRPVIWESNTCMKRLGACARKHRLHGENCTSLTLTHQTQEQSGSHMPKNTEGIERPRKGTQGPCRFQRFGQTETRQQHVLAKCVPIIQTLEKTQAARAQPLQRRKVDCAGKKVGVALAASWICLDYKSARFVCRTSIR